MKNTNNPMWNQQFEPITLDIPEEDYNTLKICFKVWEHNKVFPNSISGQAELPIDHLLN